MRIAILCPKVELGGVAKYSIRCKEMLEKNYDKVDFLFFSNNLKNELCKEKNFIKIGGKNIWWKIKNIRRYIKQNKIKCIIVPIDIAFLLAILPGIFLNIKVISIVHMRLDLYKVKANNLFKKNILRLLFRLNFKFSDKLITVSKGLEEEVIDEYPKLISKIKTIYNPIIDKKKEKEENKYIDIEKKKCINILNIGWINDLKNQKVLLEAIKDIKEKDIKVKFIGGISDDAYYKSMKKYIREMKIEGNVEFVGEIQGINKYFECSDMYILTSKSEALPTVLIEALDNSLPIISNDCKHGPREILCGEKYGLLYAENSIELKDKILEMIDNKRYNEFRKKSCERANDFSYKEISIKYMKVIEGVIGSDD